MTESGAAQPASLIQQRLALQRMRSTLVMGLVLQSVGAFLYTGSLALGGREWVWWLGVIVFVAAIVMTGVQLRSVRRDTRAFDDRYGPEAGVQPRSE
ncbi:hypothetical protein [Microbacterium sp.]|uniref:hypothetical protein n=1 Tax=Microbacterium sp. TaxID=51671 RepID=UPI003564FDD8